jgi:hypothetical protein
MAAFPVAWGSLPAGTAPGSHIVDSTNWEAIRTALRYASADLHMGGFSIADIDALYPARILDDAGGLILAPASGYDFSQAPGGSLSAGVPATVTLIPVPQGVNGADVGHVVHISNGTGTAEDVLITGGTAVSGSASGTITFTPVHSHTGAWTARARTAG